MHDTENFIPGLNPFCVRIWRQVYRAQRMEYGSGNKYEVSSLVCVDTQFQVGEIERQKSEK